MPLATRLESSKRCYWLCQTSGWNEWAVKNRSGYAGMALLSALRAQKQKIRPAEGRKNRFSLLRFYGPFGPARRLKNPVAMPGGMPAKDRGTGCTLRSVGVGGIFQQGSAGTRAREDCKETLLLTLGRRGGAPHKPSRSDGQT